MIIEVIIKRITPLEIHHLKRIKKTLSYCMYGKTVYELIANIFSKNLGPHQFFFVLSELVAHLNHGWHKKMLSRFRHRGIIKFKTVN